MGNNEVSELLETPQINFHPEDDCLRGLGVAPFFFMLVS